MLRRRVYLKAPEASDARAFARAARESIALHRPWVFPPTTEPGFRDYLERIQEGRHEGFLVVRKSDDRLVGAVNLNEIIYGAMDGAFVGYWGFEGVGGHGYMTEGVALAFDEAFGRLSLHRLEVNIQPTNLRSIALARRLGLKREGFSEKYLKIAGEWRDHERWAMTEERWEELGGSEMVLEQLGARAPRPVG